MATRHTYSEHCDLPSGKLPVEAAILTTTDSGHGIIERYRERTAARKRAWLVSPRGRRFIAQWLRRTANVATEPDAIRRRQDVLLHDRAAAVRTELLEIAAMVERAPDSDPACMAELHELLADGCTSPLYNADIHVSELHATLYSVRAGLSRLPAQPPPRVALPPTTLASALRRSHA